MRERAPASVSQVVKLPPQFHTLPTTTPVSGNILVFMEDQKCTHREPPLDSLKLFVNSWVRNLKNQMMTRTLRSAIKTGGGAKYVWVFWRQTSKIGWDESKCEQQRNIDLGRLQKTCSECGGILWKATSPDYRDERTPSPTGQQKINRERWIFAGMDAPLWDGGHFRISMIRGEEEPTMSSGDEPEPPGYQTPSEDRMDCIGPLTT